MNAFAESECLDQRLALVGRLMARGASSEMRLALEDMLRCAARLSCRQAVACSDGARAGIEQMLAVAPVA